MDIYVSPRMKELQREINRVSQIISVTGAAGQLTIRNEQIPYLNQLQEDMKEERERLERTYLK
jgi:F0F1-type ATP synthase epsilon subunit